MLGLTKLSVIGVLAGTLGLVGCSEDAGGTGGTGGAPLDVCGGDPPRMIEAGFQQDTDTVACVDTITGTFDVPIDITLAAQPTNGLAEGENDFDMQIVFTITEETISGLLGDVVEIATIGESSSDVASDNVDDTMLVKVSEAPVPCTVDFTADPDNNGMAGPINIVTPVTTGTFTVADGSVTLTAEQILFDIIAPVPLALTTLPPDGTCTWDEQPSVTFNVGAGGAGGGGGGGGGGG